MKKLNLIFLLFVIALGTYVGLSINNDPSTMERTKTEPTITEPSKDETEVTQEKKAEPINQISEPSYQVVYSIEKRYDGGISYYVLLNPVDLSKPAFIDNVKYITNKLVNDKGNKISIEFFDDKNALELSYKQYGDLSLGRKLTENENIWQGVHYIAGFSGELETDLYLNTLYLFPSASSDHPQVGKYVSIMEYNPDVH